MTFELKELPKVKVQKCEKEKAKIYINTLSPNFQLSKKEINEHTKHNYCIKL